MKVYISVDAEGLSGIFKLSQVIPGNREYEFMRRMMASDVNAAIRGAAAAGADEILVNDCHNLGDNLPIELLDPRAQLLSGADKPLIMAEGLERGFDAAMLIGYHAPKGFKGVVSHTFFYGAVVDAKINGVSFGEGDLVGHVAGYFGAPLVLATGDDCLCARCEQLMPGVHTVVTKEHIGNGSAICRHPSATAADIEKAAEAAVRQRSNIKPLRIDGPVQLDLTLSSATMAQLACNIQGFTPDAERDNLVHYQGKDYLEVYTAFVRALRQAAYFKDNT